MLKSGVSGGLFAAYDYDWPPTVNWEAEAAYRDLIACVDKASYERSIERSAIFWPKQQHLANIRASGHFRYVREVLAHHVEMGNAERFMGLALSNYAANLLERGLREEEIDVETFKFTVQRVLSAEAIPFYFSYHIRIGIK